ncbi:MAG: acyltransferase family protein [Erysipelotrichaceae bacterium]
MLENNTKRIMYLDLLRIFSIFAMMVIHIAAIDMVNVGVDTFTWQTFNLYDSLARFCVPIFFMISGVFFLDNDKKFSTKKLFSKNIIRILTALIFWSIMYNLVYVLLAYINKNPITLIDLFNRLIGGHYHLWFLFTLVGLYLIAPLLRKITEEKSKTEYFIILFFIFCLLLNFLHIIPVFTDIINILNTKINMYLVLGYSGYFVLGLYLYKYDISKVLTKAIYILGVVSILFTIIATGYISIKTGTAYTAFYDFLLPNTFFTAAAVFLFFKNVVSKVHFSIQKESFIYLLSKLTFCMYLVHVFVMQALNLVGITTLSYPAIISVPLNTILVFLISFLIASIINKIPVLNKYIM